MILIRINNYVSNYGWARVMKTDPLVCRDQMDLRSLHRRSISRQSNTEIASWGVTKIASIDIARVTGQACGSRFNKVRTSAQQYSCWVVC
jgi:hypothetical protein